jgi:hypothetical protein
MNDPAEPQDGRQRGPQRRGSDDEAELMQVIADCLHALQSGADVPYRPEELGRRISLLLATSDRGPP